MAMLNPPAVDLVRRSLDALDWPWLVDALAEGTRTPMGAAAARGEPSAGALALAPLASAADIRRAHDAIDELRRLEVVAPLPIGGVPDLRDAVRRAARGEVLDAAVLRDAGAGLFALRDLAHRLTEAADLAPTLHELGHGLAVDPVAGEHLSTAFDAHGRLSAERWPELGELRARTDALHETIRRTLDALVNGDTLGDLLQDKYVTQRGDRYVLPIKAHAKNWDIGIVHGTSGSGRTVFVEPTEVVSLNNLLRIAEGKLQAEERRILTELSRVLGRVAGPVVDAIGAVTALDLVAAREALARKLNMSRPTVGGAGVVHLVAARHPVLALRGAAVVANDLDVLPDQPLLVITGPNTGGKTVAMKTIGLCALLVRVGCFVPAAEGSRVDRFDAVLADIGDAQAVDQDLSSFSGHLVVLKQMLDEAAPNRLYLLDELCNGTDPAQGGALARAVLEALIERGPRVVATTHYAQLKLLANDDRRCALAAMEYAGGRPTYRVVPGVTGESHAFDTALRLGLDPQLMERARSLMGVSERALYDALASLEQARERASDEMTRYRALEEALRRERDALAERERRLAERLEELERGEGGEFLERMRRAERAVAAVVADLQRAPDPKKAAAARATIETLSGIIPAPDRRSDAVALGVGDRVRVRGQVGEVVAVGDGQVSVRVGALTVRAKAGECDKLSVKQEVRRAYRPPVDDARGSVDLGRAVRISSNTLDLRGFRVEEATDAVEKFFGDASSSGHRTVFLLHGHGTGALKDALRRWLPTAVMVERHGPANADQGGDAYTVVGLR
jgi:DNA mismatch repair protein MutS2